VYAVVDLCGAVTAVSLCSPVIELSQSGTATISHSLINVLTLTDVDVSGELVENNDIMTAAVATV